MATAPTGCLVWQSAGRMLQMTCPRSGQRGKIAWMPCAAKGTRPGASEHQLDDRLVGVARLAGAGQLRQVVGP